jgi:hypothetical protein
MRASTFLLLLGGCTSSSQPPTLGTTRWVVDLGPGDNASIAIDSKDNVLVASGAVSKLAAGDGSTLWSAAADAIHVATNADDAVVTVGANGGTTTEFDASGALIWNRNLGANSAAVGSGVTVGPDGAVYVVGSCTGTITIPSGSVACVQGAEPSNNAGAFVAAFDADGNTQWAQSYPLGHRITLTPDKRLVVSDSLGNTTVNFGGFTLTAGSSSEVVASLGIDGTVQWARALGIASRARNVAADTHGNVVATADANPGTVSMFDSRGNEVWRASSTTDDSFLMGVTVLPSGTIVTSSRSAFELFDANGRLADVRRYDGLIQQQIGSVLEVVASADGSLAFTGNYTNADGSVGSFVGLMSAAK